METLSELKETFVNQTVKGDVMDDVIKKELEEKHNQLRKILIENACPEYGDCIIDDICKVFDFPDTNDNKQ